MSVQKFLGTIETDGIKDERGIETPSLSATGEVSGKTGVFSESVTAPVFNGKATSAGSADNATNATNATNDGEGNNIPNTYATKEALSEETSAREAADETLSKGITAEATERSAAIEDIVDGTTVVAEATNATNATNIKAKDGTYKALADALLEMVYPIGSIYMSVSNVSPQSFLGGTWVAWGAGRVPVSVASGDSDFGTVEKTGGEKTHTLTINEMPSHQHLLNDTSLRYYASRRTPTGAGYTHSTGTLTFQSNTNTSGDLQSGNGTVLDVKIEGWASVSGGDAAHNNLQPYITCYMWKRTA